MARVGVVLSGCGFLDGAEIHESVLTLLALDRAGAEILCMAPDVGQMHVINHCTGEVVPGEGRNILTESARIARGDIQNIADVQAADLDAVVLPGGFGAAKNLCDFATAGVDCKVNPDVQRLLTDLHAQGKPIGAICIAPALIAATFRGTDTNPSLTIGTDAGTADALEKMGSRHSNCPVEDSHSDEEQGIVTTPAYMLAGRISEAAAGIEKLVKEVLRLAARRATS